MFDILYIILIISSSVIAYFLFQRYDWLKKNTARHNRIIHDSSDLIFTIDSKEKIIFCNQSFLKRMGYRRSDIHKMSISDIMVSAEQIMNHIIDSQDRASQLNDIEFILINKKKSEFLFQANISISRMQKGKITYTFIARDITENRKILNALLNSEQKFKAISENTSDAVLLLSQLNILYSNPSASQMLGYTEEELSGMSFSEVIVPEYKEIFLDKYRRRLEGVNIHNIFRVQLLPKEGSTKQVELSINVFDYKQHTAEVIIARDMTDKVMLEQQLIQAEKLASLGQLVTGISHELNNKLQPIFIYCQLLKMNAFPEKVLSQVEGIESSANSAKIILESLLKFGRPGQMIKEKSSFNDIVRDTLTLIDYKLEQQNIQLKLELDDNIPLSYFDKNQISQVILNILNNATYANELNGGEKLEVKTYTDGKMIILTIADSGPGITQTHIDRIFDPFFSTKPVGKGTGLGLSISYSIIKVHNGRIYVSNQRSGGAVFTIELPIYNTPKRI